MNSVGIFSTGNYLGKYESTIRAELGSELDGFKRFLKQLEYSCTSRLMNIDSTRPDKPITIQELKEATPEFRKKVLAALLYSDSHWRIEASYVMICAGILNVAFSNLRTALDALITAFIVERYDEEAMNFLDAHKNKPVDLTKIQKLIPDDYNAGIKYLKDYYSDIGVHSRIGAIQLSSLFGINRLDKLRAGLKNAPDDIFKLPDGGDVSDFL